jgi:hypothetical protein
MFKALAMSAFVFLGGCGGEIVGEAHDLSDGGADGGNTVCVVGPHLFCGRGMTEGSCICNGVVYQVGINAIDYEMFCGACLTDSGNTQEDTGGYSEQSYNDSGISKPDSALQETSFIPEASILDSGPEVYDPEGPCVNPVNGDLICYLNINSDATYIVTCSELGVVYCEYGPYYKSVTYLGRPCLDSESSYTCQLEQ